MEMKDFAGLFAKLVVPELARMCRFQASRIALDLVEFTEAYALVWREATRRGAIMLPSDKMDDLENYIMTTILKYEDGFRTEVLERRSVINLVARDIAETEAKWHDIWSSDGHD